MIRRHRAFIESQTILFERSNARFVSVIACTLLLKRTSDTYVKETGPTHDAQAAKSKLELPSLAGSKVPWCKRSASAKRQQQQIDSYTLQAGTQVGTDLFTIILV